MKRKKKVDPLAEATNGIHYWDDSGMDNLEQGWEDFSLGTRVEVRVKDDRWIKGISC